MWTVGCGSPQTLQPAHPTEPQRARSSAQTPESPFAPTPYTAEQIRENCPAGRTLLFVVEEPNKAPVRQRMRFLAVDDERATFMSETLDPDDKLIGESQTKVLTWEALRKHGEFPRQATQIDRTTAETPAGSFACTRYTITETIDAGVRKRTLCFADGLAGPPVEITVEQDGVLLSTMTLVQNAMPSDAP